MSSRSLQLTKTHCCRFCHQRFRRAEHLKRHLTRHTLERPFRCRQCSLCFTRKDLHSRHQRKHHGFSVSTAPSPEMVPSSRFPEAKSHYLPLSTLDAPSEAPLNAATGAESLLHMAASAWPDSAVPTTSDLVVDRGNLVAFGGGTGTAPVGGGTLGLGLDNASIQTESGPSFNVPSFGPEAPFLDNFRVPRFFLETGQEDDPWLNCLDGMSGQGYRTPYHFFTSGLESFPASPALDTLIEATAETPTDTRITEQARQRIKATMQGLDGAFKGPVDSHGQLAVPERQTLDRYWRMFWAVPGKNLPFLHAACTDPGDAPAALILSLLADGAMYCGDKHIGMAFFECSRRLVSQYVDTVGSQSAMVPLWVMQTLLMNCVFGLPGGSAPHIDLTVGSLDSLLSLASRVERSPFSSLLNNSSTVEEDWRKFVEAESYRRSLICALVVVRLWSAVYGTIRSTISNCLHSVEMPCVEVLWSASSALEWERRHLQVKSRPTHLHDAVESLFSNTVTTYTGLASMCHIVGLLIYADELRIGSLMSSTELNEHVGQAIDKWESLNAQQKGEYTASISFPTAAYARILLHVDIQAAMRAFVQKEFEKMRDILRKGDLLRACRYGIQGLVPWSVTHKNRISMVSVPCAVVVCEATLLPRNTTSEFVDLSSLIKILRDALNVPAHEDLTEPTILWASLRRIIENGPLTAALLSAMEAYPSVLK